MVNVWLFLWSFYGLFMAIFCFFLALMLAYFVSHLNSGLILTFLKNKCRPPPENISAFFPTTTDCFYGQFLAVFMVILRPFYGHFWEGFGPNFGLFCLPPQLNFLFFLALLKN